MLKRATTFKALPSGVATINSLDWAEANILLNSLIAYLFTPLTTPVLIVYFLSTSFFPSIVLNVSSKLIFTWCKSLSAKLKLWKKLFLK